VGFTREYSQSLFLDQRYLQSAHELKYLISVQQQTGIGLQHVCEWRKCSHAVPAVPEIGRVTKEGSEVGVSRASTVSALTSAAYKMYRNCSRPNGVCNITHTPKLRLMYHG
jgi:hypothetical protein